MFRLFVLNFICLLFSASASSQSFSEQNSYDNVDIELANYIDSTYQNSPFEGVKIIESDTETFLISLAVVNTTGHKSQSTMDRIAVVKARRNALTYLQGSTITSDQIVQTGETITGKSVSYYEEYFDSIKETSSGFIQGMSTLTTFLTKDGKNHVHVIYAILE